MLISKHAVRSIAREVADAAEGAMDSYRNEEVTDEPHITDRMLGAIADRLQSKSIDGVTWKAKTLRTGRGVADEEKRHGADFVGILNINLHDFSVKKGFLVQAKRAEPGIPFTQADWKRLSGHCETMLQRTPDAFVAVYSKIKGVRFFPAIEIIGSNNTDIFEHYDRRVQPFFELFLECFIGDRRLHSTAIKILDKLLDYQVGNVIVFTASESQNND